MRIVLALAAAMAVAGMSAPEVALAQRGAGQAQGIGQMATPPELTTLTGELVEVKTGPCENRVDDPDRAPIGTHIFLKTSEGETLNIHLGPARAVQGTARQLAVGQPVTVSAFRTENLPEGHYVAQRIIAGDEEFEVRGESLRPVWAAGPGQGRGPGAGVGQGRGPGAGVGQGRGMGQGPAWGGGGMGRGQGPAARMQGRGMRRGQGFGPGPR